MGTPTPLEDFFNILLGVGSTALQPAEQVK